MDNKLYKKTEYIFQTDYENASDEEFDSKEDLSRAMISKYGWAATFKSWYKYLTSECNDAKSVINFANLFWSYGGQDHPIPDPYEFLGYFYYRINFDTQKYDPGDILDSMTTTILPRNGFKKASLRFNPEYMPENDPQLISAVKNWQSKNNN